MNLIVYKSSNNKLLNITSARPCKTLNTTTADHWDLAAVGTNKFNTHVVMILNPNTLKIKIFYCVNQGRV